MQDYILLLYYIPMCCNSYTAIINILIIQTIQNIQGNFKVLYLYPGRIQLFYKKRRH